MLKSLHYNTNWHSLNSTTKQNMFQDTSKNAECETDKN